jgi:hypothetical protein
LVGLVGWIGWLVGWLVVGWLVGQFLGVGDGLLVSFWLVAQSVDSCGMVLCLDMVLGGLVRWFMCWFGLSVRASNKQLWSDSFEGEMSNLFALQNQVTTRISASLGNRMVLVAASESESRKANPQAADLILRARAESGSSSLDSLNKRDHLLRQALVQEPNNVAAMSALSHTLIMLAPRGIEQNLRK